MTNPSVADLAGLVALLMAVALYAMLLFMVLRERGWPVRQGRVARGDRLPFFTAVLGLSWNLGTLVLLGSMGADAGLLARGLSAFAYAALGFLPAVFVHAAVRPWDASKVR